MSNQTTTSTSAPVVKTTTTATPETETTTLFITTSVASTTTNSTAVAETSTTRTEDNTTLIASICAPIAGLLVLIVFAIIFIRCRKRRRKKSPRPMLPNPYPDRVVLDNRPNGGSGNVSSQPVAVFYKKKKSKKSRGSPTQNGLSSGVDNPGLAVQQDESSAADNYVNLIAESPQESPIPLPEYCTPATLGQTGAEGGIDPNRFDSEKYLKPQTAAASDKAEAGKDGTLPKKSSSSESESVLSPDKPPMQLKWTFSKRIIHKAESEDDETYFHMNQPKTRISLTPPTLPDPNLNSPKKADVRKTSSSRPPPPAACTATSHIGYINLSPDGQPWTQSEAGVVWNQSDDFYENVKELKRRASPVPPIPITTDERQPLNAFGSSDECASPRSPSSLSYVNLGRKSTDSGDYQSPNTLVEMPRLQPDPLTEGELSPQELEQQQAYMNYQNLPKQPQASSTENLNDSANTSSHQSLDTLKSKPKPKPLPKTPRQTKKPLQHAYSEDKGDSFPTLPSAKTKPNVLRKSISFDSSLDQIESSLNTNMSPSPLNTSRVNSTLPQAASTQQHYEDEDEQGMYENAEEVNSSVSFTSYTPSPMKSYIVSHEKIKNSERKTSLDVPLKPSVAPKTTLTKNKKFGSVDTLGSNAMLSELKSKFKKAS